MLFAVFDQPMSVRFAQEDQKLYIFSATSFASFVCVKHCVNVYISILVYILYYEMHTRLGKQGIDNNLLYG